MAHCFFLSDKFPEWMRMTKHSYWCLTLYRSQKKYLSSELQKYHSTLSLSFPSFFFFKGFTKLEWPQIWKCLRFALLNRWMHDQSNQLILLNNWAAQGFKQSIFYWWCSVMNYIFHVSQNDSLMFKVRYKHKHQETFI